MTYETQYTDVQYIRAMIAGYKDSPIAALREHHDRMEQIAQRLERMGQDTNTAEGKA